jgi:tRNA wybutosine-synthesizing protein 3
MNLEKIFIYNKKRTLEKLKKALKEDNVDIGILPILNIINKSDSYYTSSSCYGRIVLLEIPVIGDKKEAKFLGKWHRKIDIDDLISASKNAKKGQLWLLSQSPIIHIVAKTNIAADKILKIAISCGFKNSGLKSLDKRIVVEICSTERLDCPIGKDGKIYCSNSHLDLLVNISNKILEKSTVKLKKLEQKLRKDLSTSKTTNT